MDESQDLHGSEETLDDWVPTDKYIKELNLIVKMSDQKDMEEINEIINLLGYPNTELGLLHRDAQRLGEKDIRGYIAKSKPPICPCCTFVVQEDEIKSCVKLEDVKNLEFSTLLYLKTFGDLAIIMIIIILVFSIYAVTTNLQGSSSFVYPNLQTLDFISISLGAKELNPTEINKYTFNVECWLGVLTNILIIVTFLILRYVRYRQAYQHDSESVSVSDFSVVLQGVPLSTTQTEMEAYLNEYFQMHSHLLDGNYPFKISKYNVAKPLFQEEQSLLADKELNKLKKQYAEARKDLVNLIHERQDSRVFLTPAPKRKQMIERFMTVTREKADRLEIVLGMVKERLNKKHYGGRTTVFVTFQTSEARKQMEKLNEKNFITNTIAYVKFWSQGTRFFIKAKEGDVLPINVDRAPEPEDILWRNIGLSAKKVLLRKCFTFVITIGLLTGSFFVVYSLSEAQIQSGANKFISTAISISIVVINSIINVTINILTLWERDYTTSARQISITIKSVLAQIVNMIIIPLIVARFVKSNIYLQDGLVDNIFVLGFTSSLIPPVVRFIDPGFLYYRVMAWVMRQPSYKLSQTQAEFNETQIRPENQMSDGYTTMLSLYFFTCFYASLHPILPFFTLASLYLQYWTEKHGLFQHCRRPYPMNHFVHTVMYQMIYFGPFIFAMGELTWSTIFPVDSTSNIGFAPNIISVVLGASLILVPTTNFLRSCANPTTGQISYYNDSRIFFSSEYDRLNPATSAQAMNEYLEYRTKKIEEIGNLDEKEREVVAEKLVQNFQRGRYAQIKKEANPFALAALNVSSQAMVLPINQFHRDKKTALTMFPVFQQVKTPEIMGSQISSRSRKSLSSLSQKDQLN